MKNFNIVDENGNQIDGLSADTLLELRYKISIYLERLKYDIDKNEPKIYTLEKELCVRCGAEHLKGAMCANCFG